MYGDGTVIIGLRWAGNMLLVRDAPNRNSTAALR